MYTHEDYLAFCNEMGLNPNDDNSRSLWCDYNDHMNNPNYWSELASGR
jgi:acyl-ACP thioesterase